MSLTQLEYFVAVAEEGAISRAALRLHVSQPPLTRQIKSLEEELGAPLFARSASGTSLLPTGELFLEHARRVLEQVEAARRAIALHTGAPPLVLGKRYGSSCPGPTRRK